MHQSGLRANLLILLSVGALSCASPHKYMQPTGGIDSISQEELEGHLRFLASSELEGRDTGERGLQLAARYLSSQLQRLGLRPIGDDSTYLQHYEVERRHIQHSSTLTVQSSDSSTQVFHFKDNFILLPQAMHDGEIISGNVVFAGYGITAPDYDYDDFEKVDAKDKIVLVMRHEPREFDDKSAFDGARLTNYSNTASKVAAARVAGAKAIIIVNDPSNGHAPYEVEYKNIIDHLAKPMMSLPGEHKNLGIKVLLGDSTLAAAILDGTGKTLADLQAQIDQAMQPSSFEVEGKTLTLALSIQESKLTVTNVLGLVPGRDENLKDEVVVYSAHYDHVGTDGNGGIYHGADDDGSGTAAVLELAEAYAKASQRSRRSVLFIWFSAEEKGLLGSKYYSDNPIIPIAKTVANLNMDMVGRARMPDDTKPKNAALADERTIFVVEGHQCRELRKINEDACKETGLVIDYTYDDPNHPEKLYYRSDHYNFARKGVPVLFLTTGDHEDYHQITDTVDKIHFGKLQRVAKLAFLTGWKVADQSRRLMVDNPMPAD